MDESDVSFICYGEFTGAHVVVFGGSFDQTLTNEIVDGITFHHQGVKTFTVYHSGTFCSLQEAFDSGLLSHDDLITPAR